METKKINSEPLSYFLTLSPGILTETKDFLFDLMEETARAQSIPADRKEDRIYLISHLHRLFAGLEKQRQ
ncbi:MAG: hypothetical protein HLUCCX10_12685 [Algoriphagus marincola HL-49]|uniref:Uncharacterized protein n=1 Tax=Algoriphagus marincola HL-49 TaxID=1305737 RepID=A0A0P8BUI2_9BACT|nr:MAG: hypothetical protein HLUCCX10_12685 [Algoriphagus marincola HL-49]